MNIKQEELLDNYHQSMMAIRDFVVATDRPTEAAEYDLLDFWEDVTGMSCEEARFVDDAQLLEMIS
jgi:hypothetical protein